MRLDYDDLEVDVLGVGTALPPGAAVTNVDLLRLHPDTRNKPAAVLEDLAERISAQFGFRERYLSRWPGAPARDDESTSESLVAAAVTTALNGGRPSAFVLGSTTSRRYTGSQATAVLGRLGIEAPAFEVKAGCSTSLASLHLGHALLLQGYPDVLIATGETLSKLIDPLERETWFGLADGAAAIWLKRARGGRARISRAYFSTDGRAVDLFTTRGDLPPTVESVARGDFVLRGDGPELMRQAIQRYDQVLEALRPLLPRWILPHQVNRRLITKVLENADLSDAEVIWDAELIGNIGGASILYGLAKAYASDRFAGGGEMLAASVGGGLSFAGQVWRWA